MSCSLIRDYITDYIHNLSTTENIGASRNLNDLKYIVLDEILEDSIFDKNSCGKTVLNCLKSVYLDEDTTPCVLYDLQFTDLKISLEIKAMCFYDWYYYPKSIKRM
ncbi:MULTISPECIES: hypothetical protein [Bacillus]|uniref:hypothetical protein n=1 Tax=Bacillus TaxID=1386 RepID=UPI0004CF33DA|nr:MULTISPECIES: hypothetical protein [Bacillus]MED4547618.1 hypothetical protein [Bacillus licheniformis]